MVAALLEATEGWATGLYLAAQTAHGRSPAEWLPEVCGDQRAIADYLLGEVLERQPQDLQQFLLETSILDELTAPLCTAVTGRSESGAVLARLARENLSSAPSTSATSASATTTSSPTCCAAASSAWSPTVWTSSITAPASGTRGAAKPSPPSPLPRRR